MECQDRHPEAIPFYRKAVDLDADNFDSWMSLASCEYKVGHQTSAYEALQEALRLNSADLRMWLEWSDMLWDDENFDGAISFLEEGIKMNPTLPELYFHAAGYSFMNGMAGKGANYLENALILDPSKRKLFLRMEPMLKELPMVRNLIAQYVTE